MFCEAIWPVLVIGQLFGVMPVNGVSSPTISEHQFKWKSKRTLFSLMIGCILSAYVFLQSWKASTTQTGYISSVSSIFYFMNTLEFLCFLVFATKRPELVQFWAETERKLPSICNQHQKRKFIYKIRCTAFGFLMLGLGKALENVHELFRYQILQLTSYLLWF